jgi:hypothetical protein
MGVPQNFGTETYRNRNKTREPLTESVRDNPQALTVRVAKTRSEGVRNDCAEFRKRQIGKMLPRFPSLSPQHGDL